jgi:glutamyl-tRNA synthetase
MKKVEDYAKDEIARLPQDHFNKEALAWVELHDKTLYEAMMKDLDYTKKVLSIERSGDKPRKDVTKWSDIPEQFGYFFDDVFETNILPSVQRENEQIFSDESQADLRAYVDAYDASLDKDAWFEQLKLVAETRGYALERKQLIEKPEAFKGGVADFAALVRIYLTAKTRTPDLWSIMQIMGEQRVKRRLGD